MNTSDPNNQLFNGHEGSSPEWSVAQLERMANDLFHAHPGASGDDVVALAHHQIDAQALQHPKALACSKKIAGWINEKTASSAEVTKLPFDIDGLDTTSLYSVKQGESFNLNASAFNDYQYKSDNLGFTVPTGETEFDQLLKQLNTVSLTVPQLTTVSDSYYFINETQIPSIQNQGNVTFDVNAVRRDFPILQERVNGRPLIWFDNAATTQKPQVVIDRLSYFYQHENSNIHRAAHELAARATDAYEGAREITARFLNASSSDEIIFVRGATEAINLVAKSWGIQNIGKDDEIVITWLEHHANIVPWQQLCAVTGAHLRVAPVDDQGQIILDEFNKLLNSRTRLVAVTQVSNALGTVTPVDKMIEMAHRYGAKVLVDGAQSVSHLRVDVQKLNCDWFVFSGHKIFGPTGIGALYGKGELLNSTQPWQGGGNMIEDVTFEHTRYHLAPARFEAGTGNIADAVGLGAALEYVEKLGIENINRYEHELLAYATKEISSISGLRLIGTATEKASVLSFVLEGFSTEDVGAALNREGIAVRSGHHCAQPILRRFGVESTVRPSLAFYNTYAEVDVLISTLRSLKRGSQKGI